MRTHLVATLVAVMLSVAPAAAQEPAPDDIIVTGTRLNEMIREFVGEVSTAQTAEDQIARWNRNVCTQIAGLHQREAQFVADRIAQRAHQVQLRPGGPNCRANVLIFVTPDADRFTQELTRLFPEVFDPNVANMHTQGDQALAAFVSNERPVRWWHVSQTVSREGAIVRNSDPRWRAGTGGTDGLTGLTVVRTNANSRLERATRQDFNRVVIVVDATRAAGQRFDALADYVAMIALSQVDPEADVSPTTRSSTYSHRAETALRVQAALPPGTLPISMDSTTPVATPRTHAARKPIFRAACARATSRTNISRNSVRA